MNPIIRAYRGHIADVRALVQRIADARTAAPQWSVQLVRADRVYGADHLRHAADRATRAFADGRARAADVPTETLLYAAGDRQIGRALKFMGLTTTTAGIAAIAWGPDAEARLDAFAEKEGWERDDALLAGDPSVLDAYGVTEVERAMLPRERWDEFILERVALLDVQKA